MKFGWFLLPAPLLNVLPFKGPSSLSMSYMIYSTYSPVDLISLLPRSVDVDISSVPDVGPDCTLLVDPVDLTGWFTPYYSHHTTLFTLIYIHLIKLIAAACTGQSIHLFLSRYSTLTRDQSPSQHHPRSLFPFSMCSLLTCPAMLLS